MNNLIAEIKKIKSKYCSAKTASKLLKLATEVINDPPVTPTKGKVIIHVVENTKELSINVRWQHFITYHDELGWPPAHSRDGFLYGLSDDPRLLSKYILVIVKIDQKKRIRFPQLSFLAPPEDVKGKNLLINRFDVGKIQFFSVPSTEWTRFYAPDLSKKYIKDHGGGYGSVRTSRIRYLSKKYVENVYKDMGIKLPDWTY